MTFRSFLSSKGGPIVEFSTKLFFKPSLADPSTKRNTINNTFIAYQKTNLDPVSYLFKFSIPNISSSKEDTHKNHEMTIIHQSKTLGTFVH